MSYIQSNLIINIAQLLTMKILFYNIAYEAGLNGSWKQYIFKIWRFFYPSKKSHQKIAQLLKKEDADVVCLAEIDKGSLRNLFKSQIKRLKNALNIPHYFGNSKYGKGSLWHYVPMVRQQYDAILSKKEAKIYCHYLEHGMKKLVQELVINNISIFTVHLSVLQKRVRKLQLEELSQMIKKCPRPQILCGDFNNHSGLKEIEDFMKKTKMKLVNRSATFPSINPKRTIDLFFTSSEIEVLEAGVCPVTYSDHLPTWIKIQPQE